MADEFSQIPIDSVPSPVEDAFKDGHQSEHVSAPADEDTASTLEDRKRHPAKKRKGDVLSDGEPQDCDTWPAHLRGCESGPSVHSGIKQMWDTQATMGKQVNSATTNYQTIPTWNWYFCQLEDGPERAAKSLKAVNEDINNKVSLWRGNMCDLEIDAVQNAANSSLLGGGGIDGALHRGAGRAMVKETKLLSGCNTGCTKISRGYHLPARYVLHTVGPIGEHPEELKRCYRTTLDLAVYFGARSVALCGVSTGIYGYPRTNATHVALHTVRQWLENERNRQQMDRIVFVVFLGVEKQTYETLMPLYFPAKCDGSTTASAEFTSKGSVLQQ